MSSASLDILLPFYGDVVLMQTAVRSVLGQTDGDFQLYVVDDGYPDDSVASWFDSIDDHRVTYLRNATNLGANGNYRRALDLATADYVVVMGADDVMKPGYVSAIRGLIERFPSASVFQPGVEVIDGEGHVVRPLTDRIKRLATPRGEHPVCLRGEALARSLLRANWTYFPSLCWERRRIVEIGFRPGLDVVQDLALLVDVVLGGGAVVVDQEVEFQYRRHLGSDSAVRAAEGSRFDEEATFFALVADECRHAGWPSASRSARLHLTSRLNAASLLSRALAARRFGAARRLARHVIRW